MVFSQHEHPLFIYFDMKEEKKKLKKKEKEKKK